MVAPMVQWLRAAALGALAMTAQACGDSGPKDAARTAQALLDAIQTGDAKAFETVIDRPALRADLRRQMIAVGRANGLDVGGPSDVALDLMIDPAAFHLVQAGGATPLGAAPSLPQVQALLKPLDKTRVCLHDLTPQQACRLTFAREAAGWRLVGMPAADLTIEVGAEPAKPR
jgi:hypothetical protein